MESISRTASRSDSVFQDQTFVIIGATDRFGRALAERAAARGASVLLCSSNQSELEKLARRLRAAGGDAQYTVVDVADPDDLRRAARTAVEKFGGFHVWVNASEFPPLDEAQERPLALRRHIFETLFWGTVYGCRTALPYLKERGGMIFNIGASFPSDRFAETRGEAWEAVRAYTEKLQQELQSQNYAIEVEHGSPGETPEQVAQTALRHAERAVRRRADANSAKVYALIHRFAPGLLERITESILINRQRSAPPPAAQRSAPARRTLRLAAAAAAAAAGLVWAVRRKGRAGSAPPLLNAA